MPTDVSDFPHSEAIKTAYLEETAVASGKGATAYTPTPLAVGDGALLTALSPPFQDITIPPGTLDMEEFKAVGYPIENRFKWYKGKKFDDLSLEIPIQDTYWLQKAVANKVSAIPQTWMFYFEKAGRAWCAMGCAIKNYEITVASGSQNNLPIQRITFRVHVVIHCPVVTAAPSYDLDQPFTNDDFYFVIEGREVLTQQLRLVIENVESDESWAISRNRLPFMISERNFNVSYTTKSHQYLYLRSNVLSYSYRTLAAATKTKSDAHGLAEATYTFRMMDSFQTVDLSIAISTGQAATETWSEFIARLNVLAIPYGFEFEMRGLGTTFTTITLLSFNDVGCSFTVTGAGNPLTTLLNGAGFSVTGGNVKNYPYTIIIAVGTHSLTLSNMDWDGAESGKVGSYGYLQIEGEFTVNGNPNGTITAL